MGKKEKRPSKEDKKHSKKAKKDEKNELNGKNEKNEKNEKEVIETRDKDKVELKKGKVENEERKEISAVNTEMEIITEAFSTELMEISEKAKDSNVKMQVLISSIKSGQALNELERILVQSNFAE